MEQKVLCPNPFVDSKKEVLPKLFKFFQKHEMNSGNDKKLETLNSNASADYIQSHMLLKFYSQYVNEMENGKCQCQSKIHAIDEPSNPQHKKQLIGG